MLREERDILGDQCAELLPSFQMVTPNLPIPANKNAVQTLCRREMKRLIASSNELHSSWDFYSKQNHYNKTHMYMTNTYLDSCPVSERILKARLLHRSVVEWRQRYNRDSMSFEDERSKLVEQIHIVRQRQRDYSVYYILSARYGVYSLPYYSSLPSPGAHYLKHVQTAALTIQALWNKFWSRISSYRFANVTVIQSCWRRYYAMKKYYPQVALRIKMKPRLRLMACLQRWRAYLILCSKMKLLIKEWKDDDHFRNLAYQAWKLIYFHENRKRNEVIQPLLSRYKLRHLRGAFHHFRDYVFQINSFRRVGKSLLRYAHFYMWRTSVRDIKKERVILKARAVVSKAIRVNRARIILMLHKALRDKLKRIMRMIGNLCKTILFCIHLM